MWLVTGASGAVGRALVQEWQAAGVRLRCVVRRPVVLPAGVDMVVLPDLAQLPPRLFTGVTALVQLAGLAHQRQATPAALRAVNHDLTLAVARTALATGVTNFCYLSSLAVTQTQHIADADLWGRYPYAASKRAAEQALAALVTPEGGRLQVLRPPLILASAAAGSLAQLHRLLRYRLPLPFASIANRRSVIGTANLADAIASGLRPGLAAGTFAVADEAVLRTPELVRLLAAAWGLPPPLLLPCPTGLLRRLLGVAGGRLTESVLDDALADNGPVRAAWGWHPPHPLSHSLSGLRAGAGPL